MATKKKGKLEKVNTLRGDTFAIPITQDRRVSVEMRKVENGFIVSSYCPKRQRDMQYVEVDKAAAQKRATQLLGGVK